MKRFSHLFTLSKDDIQQYGRRNQYAQMMFCGAGDDYTAARCLSFNLLMSSGFPLFSQSVEKLLKAIIFLETSNRPNLRGPDRHNPYLLKQELSRTTDYGLDEYDTVLQKLYGHFQNRYYDNQDRSSGMNSNELDRFDELWMHLFERLPFPTEIKFRLKFTAMLFDKNAMQWMPNYRFWVIHQNKAFAGKLREMEELYRAVENYYRNTAI